MTQSLPSVVAVYSTVYVPSWLSVICKGTPWNMYERDWLNEFEGERAPRALHEPRAEAPHLHRGNVQTAYLNGSARCRNGVWQARY